jgi:VanZ family protein
MLLIWNVSAMPSPPGPPGVPDWLQHGLVYFVLALTAARACAGGRWAGVTAGSLAAAWMVAALYGASDEWHQMYVPGRFPEFRDLLADAVGALAGVLAVKACGIIVRRS